MTLLKEGKTGAPEAVVLVMLFIGSELFSAYPTRMAELGMSAGWMLPLIAAVFAIPGIAILWSLLARFPGRSIVEISEEVLGSWLGLLVSLAYLAYFLFLTVLTLRQYADRILLALLPSTPLAIIMFLLLLAALLACYLGLETMGRATVFIFPLVLASVLLSMVLVYPFWNNNNLFPFWGSGPLPLLTEGVQHSSFYGQILVLAVIYPLIRGGKKPYRIWLVTLGLTAVIMVFGTLVALMVFPPVILKENAFPMLQMSRLIFFGRFIQRIEAAFVLFWILGVVLRVALGYYASLTVLTRILKLPYFRPFLLPLAIIIFSAAFLLPNLTTVLRLNMIVYWDWGWVFAYAIPLLLLIIARLRRKGGETASAES